MVIDKTSAVDYRIQLIGTCHQLVVHRNRLKLFHGNASKAPQGSNISLTVSSWPSYADAVKNNSSTASPSAGSTSSVEDLPTPTGATHLLSSRAIWEPCSLLTCRDVRTEGGE